MKVEKVKENGFEYNVELSEFDDLVPVENPKGELKKDKMVLGYNKEMNYYYISCYYLNPLDSYGATWDVTDSGCFSFKPEELDQLIIELQKLRKQGE